MTEQIIGVALAVLVSWRISSLFVYESGPFNIFRTVREKIGAKKDVMRGTCTGSNVFAEMLCCIRCTSFWISCLAALFVTQDVRSWPILSLAINTLVIALDHYINHT